MPFCDPHHRDLHRDWKDVTGVTAEPPVPHNGASSEHTT